MASEPTSGLPSEPASDDRLAGLLRATWWLRGGVFIVVAGVVLNAHGSAAAAIAELAIGAAALGGWRLSYGLPEPWAQRLLVSCLIAMGAVGGFAATSHHETSILALAIMGTLAAGFELAWAGVITVLLAGVLAVEIGAVSYGTTDLGTVLGYPALLLSISVLGRYRRVYRAQAEQAEALLAESHRAQVETERAAALTERSRIAREIHDVLAHSLGALGIQLQAAEVMLTERQDIDSALRSIARARRLVDEGLTETRRAVHALHSDAPPLPQALAASITDGSGALTVVGEPEALTPAAGLALLRVGQEAISNARKHADGAAVAITLTYLEDAVELRVANPYTGASSDDAGGYGLAGMHERLRLIGGELTAGADGDRWVVWARVQR